MIRLEEPPLLTSAIVRFGFEFPAQVENECGPGPSRGDPDADKPLAVESAGRAIDARLRGPVTDHATINL